MGTHLSDCLNLNNSSFCLHHGQGNEGDESHEGNGCYESNEGHEEEKGHEGHEGYGCYESNEGHEEEKGHEGDEGHGCHEGNESHEEVKIERFAEKGTQEGQAALVSDHLEHKIRQSTMASELA